MKKNLEQFYKLHVINSEGSSSNGSMSRIIVRKYHNLNLKPVSGESNPSTTGSVDSVPLSSYTNSSSNAKGGLFFDNNKIVATKLIAHFFSPVRALASKPLFTLVQDYNTSNSTKVFKGGTFPVLAKEEAAGQQELKVVVNLFYYISNRDQALSNSTVNSLGNALTKLFGLRVELRLVRLHYPYLNSYILAQYVAINTKKYNFTRIQRAIFGALRLPRPKSIVLNHLSTLEEGNGSNSLLENRLLPSHITGIMIRISGRLTTQRAIPRQTVQTAHIGTFSSFAGGSLTGGTNSSKGMKNVIETALFTGKNKKGAFTVKVWISQLPSVANN